MMAQFRRFLLAAAVAAIAVLRPQSADSVGLGIDVSPAKLDISSDAGRSLTLPITVHNSAPDSAHIQATMVDFGVGPDGSYQYQKVGARPYSLMRFASINPREFDLPAGTSQQVVFTILMPEGEHYSGEYAGIVFFQTRPSRRPGQSVAFSARVASKIYETIPGTSVLSGVITKMSSLAASGGRAYRVIFHNSGNTHVYLRGSITVQKNGQPIDQVAMENNMLVERGGDRTIQVNGKALPPGQYQAVAQIDYGGKTDTGGVIDFTVR